MYLAPYGGRVLNINQGGHRRSRFGVPTWLLVSERRRHIGGVGGIEGVERAHSKAFDIISVCFLVEKWA